MPTSWLDTTVTLYGTLEHVAPRPEMEGGLGRLASHLFQHDPLNSRFNFVKVSDPAVEVEYTNRLEHYAPHGVADDIRPELLQAIVLFGHQACSVWDHSHYLEVIETQSLEIASATPKIRQPLVTSSFGLLCGLKGRKTYPWMRVSPRFHGIKDPAGTTIAYLVAGLLGTVNEKNSALESHYLAELINLAHEEWDLFGGASFRRIVFTNDVLNSYWEREQRTFQDRWDSYHGHSQTANQSQAEYCEECGTGVSTSAKFCQNCGTKIG